MSTPAKGGSSKRSSSPLPEGRPGPSTSGPPKKKGEENPGSASSSSANATSAATPPVAAATPPVAHNNNNRNAKDGKDKSCCFCWCCCCSCSWCVSALSRSLSVHNQMNRDKKMQQMAAAGDNFSSEPEAPPTVDEIRSWGDSFDRLMKCSGGRRVFRDFLRCEYSEENILFWLACEDLKRESNPELVEEKARSIYEDYVSILSPKEVSLDSKVREIVNKNMVAPTQNTFDEAQLQIYTLMHRDSYPRFVSSHLYRRLAQLSPPTPPTRKTSISVG